MIIAASAIFISPSTTSRFWFELDEPFSPNRKTSELTRLPSLCPPPQPAAGGLLQEADQRERAQRRAGLPHRLLPEPLRRPLHPQRRGPHRAEVDLADVVVAQHGGVPGVGGVVGGAVVDGAAGGEGQAGLQPVLLDQPAGAVLQTLAARGP